MNQQGDGRAALTASFAKADVYRAPTPPPSKLKPVPPTSRSVLLVEDNESYSYLTRRLLQQINPALEVRIAKNGQEALALIEQRQPQLVLVDLIMPTVSGLELLQELKGHEDTVRIPVIVLTAHTENERVWVAYQHSANAFLVKPDAPEQLQVVLEALVDFWFKHVLLPPTTNERFDS